MQLPKSFCSFHIPLDNQMPFRVVVTEPLQVTARGGFTVAIVSLRVRKCILLNTLGAVRNDNHEAFDHRRYFRDGNVVGGPKRFTSPGAPVASEFSIRNRETSRPRHRAT